VLLVSRISWAPCLIALWDMWILSLGSANAHTCCSFQSIGKQSRYLIDNLIELCYWTCKTFPQTSFYVQNEPGKLWQGFFYTKNSSLVVCTLDVQFGWINYHKISQKPLIYVSAMTLLSEVGHCVKKFSLTGFYWSFDCEGGKISKWAMLINNIVSGLCPILAFIFYCLMWLIVRKQRAKIGAIGDQFVKERMKLEVRLIS